MILRLLQDGIRKITVLSKVRISPDCACEVLNLHENPLFSFPQKTQIADSMMHPKQ